MEPSVNGYLHSSCNSTTTLCGLVKVGCNNLYRNASVFSGQAAVHSFVWKSWERKDGISNTFMGSPSTLYVFDPMQEQNLACCWALLDLRELAPTFTTTKALRKASQHRRQPRMVLSVFINPELQPDVNSKKFQFEILQDASEKLDDVCHESRCCNVSYLLCCPRGLQQWSGELLLRSAFLSLCLVAKRSSDNCAQVWCAGIRCRYLYTKTEETFTFTQGFTVLAPPLSRKKISFTSIYHSHILCCFFSPLFP